MPGRGIQIIAKPIGTGYFAGLSHKMRWCVVRFQNPGVRRVQAGPWLSMIASLLGIAALTLSGCTGAATDQTRSPAAGRLKRKICHF
jgi:hypothetical protein